MIRLVPLLLLPVFGLCGLAAPVPPESDRDKVARLWGKLETPSGEYTAKPDGNRLTLRSLGWPLPFDMNPPEFRVSREVIGDFDVSVKLVALDRPDRSVYYESSGPQTAAGLFITAGKSHFGLYHWMAFHKDGWILLPHMQSSLWMQRTGELGGGGSMLADIEPGESTLLRIVRRDKAVTLHARIGSGQWKQWDAPNDITLPDAVTVGIFLGHSTSQQCEATFEELRVGKPEKAEKPE